MFDKPKDSISLGLESRDVTMGGLEEPRAPPVLLNLQESWSKVSQAGGKRGGHSIFCDLLLVTI